MENGGYLRHKMSLIVVCGAVVALISGVAFYFVKERNSAVDRAIIGTRMEIFPLVDTANFSEPQRRVLAVVKEQFAHPKEGPFYAQGAKEPWCADFVSWVRREAAIPLINPNSGSWRIPGVLTMVDYFRSIGKFVNSEYRLVFGDLILYDKPSPFGQHVNMVVSFDGTTVTTLGGNERGGVAIHRFVLANDLGILGYGKI